MVRGRCVHYIFGVSFAFISASLPSPNDQNSSYGLGQHCSIKKHTMTEILGNFQWYLIRNPHNYSLSIQNNTIKNKKNGKHILSYEDSVLPEEPTAGSRVNTITQPLWFAPLRALNPTRSGTHLITAPAPLTRKERYM